MSVSDVYLEQALEELEVLRKENEVLKERLTKAIRILKEIERLLEKYKGEKE